jgi:hypothetical protein
MRYASFLIGAVLLLAMNVNAQINVVNPPPSDAFPQVALLPPSANPFGFGALPGAAPAGITGSSAAGAPFAEPPQQVQSVYETYNWQAYIGYEYLRYYQVPAVTLNTNGFTYSMVYYIKNWVGADGEFDATHLNEFNTGGWLLLGMGGARFRWSAPRGLEVWAHSTNGVRQRARPGLRGWRWSRHQIPPAFRMACRSRYGRDALLQYLPVQSKSHTGACNQILGAAPKLRRVLLNRGFFKCILPPGQARTKTTKRRRLLDPLTRRPWIPWTKPRANLFPPAILQRLILPERRRKKKAPKLLRTNFPAPFTSFPHPNLCASLKG